MPDQNKLQRLDEQGYKIEPCCTLCIHGRFGPFDRWGTCSVSKYTHGKHTGPAREVSVHEAGSCPEVKLDPSRVQAIVGSTFQRFIPAQLLPFAPEEE